MCGVRRRAGLLLLTGLVVQEARDEDAEHRRDEDEHSAREVQRSHSAEPFEWGLSGKAAPAHPNLHLLVLPIEPFPLHYRPSP